MARSATSYRCISRCIFLLEHVISLIFMPQVHSNPWTLLACTPGTHPPQRKDQTKRGVINSDHTEWVRGENDSFAPSKSMRFLAPQLHYLLSTTTYLFRVRTFVHTYVCRITHRTFLLGLLSTWSSYPKGSFTFGLTRGAYSRDKVIHDSIQRVLVRSWEVLMDQAAKVRPRAPFMQHMVRISRRVISWKESLLGDISFHFHFHLQHICSRSLFCEEGKISSFVTCSALNKLLVDPKDDEWRRI